MHREVAATMRGQDVRRGLSRVMMRFPARRRLLETRYQSDENLRSLCAVYEDAQQAVDSRRGSIARLSAEIAEFDSLISGIEADISLYMSREAGEPLPSGDDTRDRLAKLAERRRAPGIRERLSRIRRILLGLE
jgi:hypothetical protein